MTPTETSDPVRPGGLRVALETTVLSRPAGQRGLGRYANAVIEAAQRLGYELAPMALDGRCGRAGEFLDLWSRRRGLAPLAYDVFHAPHPQVMALGVGRPTVATIHDVIPLDMPQHRKTGLKARFFLSLAARADVVLTISAFSAERIVRLLGVPEHRVRVSPLPPRPEFSPDARARADELLAARGIAPPYFAALADLSTPDPRKRAGWLPPIAEELRREGRALVVAGAATEGLRSESCGLVGVGRLPDRDLAALFAGAEAFVWTSAYEGQGLPPLEAMACGTPVVAMRNTAVAEVVADGGLLVEEEASASGERVLSESALARRVPAGLIAACRAVAADAGLRATLRRRGLRRAGDFTSDRFADSLGAAYSAAVAS